MSLSEEAVDEQIEVVMEVHSVASTPDPPMIEWSSLLFERKEENVKRLQHAAGLYDPGSGEICTKYIAQSASSMYRHPYYHYPAVVDPGIEKAFLGLLPKATYGMDGKDLYFKICEEMNQCPVRQFYDSLTEKEIDLSYYSINPFGVRAMAKALETNPYVLVLNFTENYLNDDACFHLGELLSLNSTIVELNLSGCQIGASGLRRILSGCLQNRTLVNLTLNSNDLRDEGAEIIKDAIQKRLAISELFLSYNKLGEPAARALADGMDWNNTLSKLDLSWNNLSPTKGICKLLNVLAESKNLTYLDLSWNGLEGEKMGNSLKKVLLCPKLSYLSLRNNRIQDSVLINIVTSLRRARKLVTLDLSTNPITAAGATNVISKLKFRACGIKNLIMDNVPVDTIFIEELKAIYKLKFRSDLKVTTGLVTPTVKRIVGPDLREVVLNRMVNLCLKPKRRKVNFALFNLRLAKEVECMDVNVKAYTTFLKDAGGSAVDDDLIDQLINCFPGPIVAKEKTLDLAKLIDYIKRKWPDEKLPPTPPPEPPPPPPPPVVKPPKKGGKKK